MSLRSTFKKHDGPTLLVALAIYSAWLLMVIFHASIPWWLMIPLGAYIIAWQFSLQHEAIHAFRGVSPKLRLAIVFPPLGLWFPFPLYRKSHSIHHRDHHLTVPGEDTETYYVPQAEWQGLGPIPRTLLMFNQTLLGRLLIGPLLRLAKLVSREVARVRRKDYSHLPHWAVHVVAVAALFWFISGVCGFPWWQYVLLVAYPGMSLGLLRAFTEHRAADTSDERTAIVESNAVFGLLFLNNNLHIAHHLNPSLPWFKLPGYYRTHKADLLNANGNFVFRGYGEIARKYFLRAVFVPVHPTR